MDSIELARVNHFVLAKQHLSPGTKSDDLDRIIGDVGGLHATAVTTPYLSLFARVPSFERSSLDRALYVKHTLGRIRCVRNTIYVHPRDVLPFAFRATVDMVTRGSERFMRARGISPNQFETISQDIIALLTDKGEMTASTIKSALDTGRTETNRLDVSAALNLLCDQGVLVRARPEKSWRDRRQLYALFAGYFPGVDLYAIDEREATRRLVRHYLAAFGPVTENDVIWWMGLGKRKARQALADLADQTTLVRIAGLDGEFVVLCSDLDRLHCTAIPARPVINLLPVLDAYIMGYKDRARYLDARDQDFTFDRSGNGTSTIVVSGRVAGVWDAENARVQLIKLFLFRPVDRDLEDALISQAQKLGCFIFDREASVRWCTSMVPLTKRTAGSMMSPLKGCPLQDEPGHLFNA